VNPGFLKVAKHALHLILKWPHLAFSSPVVGIISENFLTYTKFPKLEFPSLYRFIFYLFIYWKTPTWKTKNDMGG